MRQSAFGEPFRAATMRQPSCLVPAMPFRRLYYTRPPDASQEKVMRAERATPIRSHTLPSANSM